MTRIFSDSSSSPFSHSDVNEEIYESLKCDECFFIDKEIHFKPKSFQ